MINSAVAKYVGLLLGGLVGSLGLVWGSKQLHLTRQTHKIRSEVDRKVLKNLGAALDQVTPSDEASLDLLTHQYIAFLENYISNNSSQAVHLNPTVQKLRSLLTSDVKYKTYIKKLREIHNHLLNPIKS